MLEGNRVRDGLEDNAVTDLTHSLGNSACSVGEERGTYMTCTTTPMPDRASLSTAFSMACEIVSKRWSGS